MRKLAIVLCLSALAIGPSALADHQGNMPAYYDGQIFTINLMELPSSAEEKLLEHNPGLNIIYESDECSPEGAAFIPVIDAIPGDGMNPLWQEVQIHFTNPDFLCQQFVKDDDITAAASAGDITLEFTSELYRCSVVGPKPAH